MLLIEAKFTPAVWLNPDSTKGAPNENGTFYRIGQYNSSGSLLAYFQGYYNEYPQEILNKLQATNGYYKVATYENGITYYGIWPRNKELLHSHKRNSYYKVAITHIHGAGEPLPKDVVDPDVDPDDVDTWGDLRIYFVTWDDENRVIIIGDETEDDSLNGTFTPKPWDEDEQENTLDGNNAWD
ncbi:MAG: hypothetical protein LUD74_02760 [Tannerellaceae bacterium]|nr:hypothetical protein [Tannerellaceae bacterium]